MRLYSLGTITASAGHIPAAAHLPYQAAFEQGPGRRRKPWIELAPPPPLMPVERLRHLHRNQLHTAVAKALGKRGIDFCAAVMIDLCGTGDTYTPSPWLAMATTRFRRPFKGEDRIDLAVHECNDEFLRYYAEPRPQELAHIVFNEFSRYARHKVVVTCGGLRTDDGFTWGRMAALR